MTMSDIVCPKCKSQNWYEWSTDAVRGTPQERKR